MSFLQNYHLEEIIIEKIQKTFKTYGYRQITVPTLQKYSTFSNINSTVLNSKMFKLIDNQGEILVLRPDVTIPIAKMVAKQHSGASKNPLKLFYTSKVFRMSSQGTRQREFMQAGVEYFGNEEIECDAEMVVLAIDTLRKIDTNIQLELGNIEFYKGLLEEIEIDNAQHELLRKLVENKNLGEMKKLVDKLNLDDHIKSAFFEMPKMYGEFEDVISKAKNLCVNPTMEKALKDLERLYQIIKDYGYHQNVSVDLGLVNHLDYYTGIIYKGYILGHGKFIMSGGRYDELTKQYGQSIPACGFAINIDELTKGVTLMEICKSERFYIDYLIVYTDSDRKEGLRIGQELRALGFVVETESIRGTLKNSIQYAEQQGIKEIITPDGDKLKLISIKNNSTIRVPVTEFLRGLDVKKTNENLLSIH